MFHKVYRDTEKKIQFLIFSLTSSKFAYVSMAPSNNDFSCGV